MIKFWIYGTRKKKLSLYEGKVDGVKGIVYEEAREVFIKEYGSEAGRQRFFQDEENIKVLKACGIELSEEGWKSLLSTKDKTLDEKWDRLDDGYWNGYSAYLSKVFPDPLYPMLLLDCSRKGYYLEYRILKKEIWQVLEKMPFDILAAMDGQDYKRTNDYFYALMSDDDGALEEAEDFIFPDKAVIVNYPYRGKEIEVHITDYIHENDSFYRRIVSPEPEPRSDGFYNTERALYTGKDGLYYADFVRLENNLDYYWGNDLEGVIYYFENEYKESLEKSASVKEIYSKDKYKGLPDGFTIISHMKLEKDEWGIGYFISDAKYPTIMVIGKCLDGTIKIYADWVGKYPTMGEVLQMALQMWKGEREVFFLFVDVEGYIRELELLQESVRFGVRKAQRDSMEIFDKDEAVKLFVEGLKEYIRQ